MNDWQIAAYQHFASMRGYSQEEIDERINAMYDKLPSSADLIRLYPIPHEREPEVLPGMHAAYREAYRRIAQSLCEVSCFENVPVAERIKEIVNRPVGLNSKGLPRSPATTPSEMSREGSDRDWPQGAQTFTIEQYGVADRPLDDSRWQGYVDAVRKHIEEHCGEAWEFG